jgi:hypothetical protein
MGKPAFSFRGRPKLKLVKQPASIFQEAIRHGRIAGLQRQSHDELDAAAASLGLSRHHVSRWLIETDHSLRERLLAVIKGAAMPLPRLSRFQRVRRWAWSVWREWRATR